jgi:hypothetical protein
VSLRKETLKNRKEDFRSKVLKKEKKSKVKEGNNREKKQRGCCLSPSNCPAYLIPTFCMSVFYRLSFLHLQLPPVRSGGTREREKARYRSLRERLGRAG